MTIALRTPDVPATAEALRALAGWQRDGGPVHLHPGDLGWNWSFGAEAVAAATRVWTRDGEPVALGMLDSPDVLRLAIAPDVQADETVARALLTDLTQPDRGVLPAGEVSVEARSGTALRPLLLAAGWEDGEPWTPLTLPLAEPPPEPGLRIETAGPGQVDLRTAVHRAAFDRSTFGHERWRAMAAGPAYADARCLLGYDADGTAVAAATVWSAGPGRPGLLEPVGVHREHRGHGYGRAISYAAARALRELGASSATVCTPSANRVAVATYRSAGFEQHPDARDLHRGPSA